MKPEEIFRAEFDKHIEKYFEVEREVQSECKTGRIDYILRCKETYVMFGVEVKSYDLKRGEKYGKFLNQAGRYTKLFWNSKNWGRVQVPVFIAPALSLHFVNLEENWEANIIENAKFIEKSGYETTRDYVPVRHHPRFKHSNMNSLIGECFNVGEIKGYKHHSQGFTFSFLYRNYELWTVRYNRVIFKEDIYGKYFC